VSKYLGVIITHDLSPSTHISDSEIVAKTHQRANIILRCFMSNDKRLLRAFFAYELPILEYCSVVCRSPCIKRYWLHWKGTMAIYKEYLA